MRAEPHQFPELYVREFAGLISALLYLANVLPEAYPDAAANLELLYGTSDAVTNLLSRLSIEATSKCVQPISNILMKEIRSCYAKNTCGEESRIVLLSPMTNTLVFVI